MRARLQTSTGYWMTCFASLTLVAVSAWAGGPLIVQNNRPVLWPSSMTEIKYTVDQGALGSLSNFRANNLIDRAFRAWQPSLNSPYLRSTLTFVKDPNPLPVDITVSNYQDMHDQILEETNPVIFDNDGRIIDLLLGSGSRSSILGFATVFTQNSSIVRSRVILNGYYISRNNQSEDEILSTVLHEIGHLCGLDHAQHSRHIAYNGLEDDDGIVPIMFPTSTGEQDRRSSLALDDQLSISNLYPSFSHLNQSGTIEGTVRRGSTELLGVNVIAREQSDPDRLVSTTITGTERLLSGSYRLPGLPPGNYEVMIEAIDRSFTGTSSVGQHSDRQLDQSFVNPVKPEYYNANDQAVEGLSVSTLVNVVRARTVEAIDIQAHPNALTDSEREEIGFLLSLQSRTSSGALPNRFTREFLLNPSGTEAGIRVSIRFDATAVFTVRVRRETAPGRFATETFNRRASEFEFTIGPSGAIPLEATRYYIAVGNTQTSPFRFTISASSIDANPTPTPEATPTPTVTPTSTPTSRPTLPTPTPRLTPTPRPTSIRGDMNGDGLINLSDIYAFTQDWHKRRFENRLFESDIVTDPSLRVNHADLLLLIQLYLAATTTEPPRE